MKDGPRIAIVHFHFRRGGVTRVVESAVRALEAFGARIVVLSGEPTDSSVLAEYLEVVQGLGYDDSFSESGSESLRENLESAAKRRLGAAPDVWHIHNHSLGKNLNFIPLLNVWSATGEKLLLQIHDFAEDGRPANYRAVRKAGLVSSLYPQAHYAVLNGRDRAVLTAAGCRQIHDLPNPVDGFDLPLGEPKATPERILYLTRAIRRKNIGELIYWSVGAPEGTRFATSLAPDNPAEQARYGKWEHFVEEWELPVDLNHGGKNDHSLEALLTEADALITTSVAEGFGLSFLEPWLAGLPVVGRNLPEITSDFESVGIGLAHMYEAVKVELNQFDFEGFRQRREMEWVKYNEAYGRCVEPAPVQGMIGSCRAAQSVFYDFGALDEIAQREVIRMRIQSNAPANRSGLAFPSAATTLKNREVVKAQYNLPQYGQRLLETYGRVVSERVDTGFDAEAVLAEFLNKKRFNMLRT